MKLFFKKIALFIAVSCCVLVVCLFVLNYTNNKIFVRYARSISDSILFIGDSHVKLAMDDEIMVNTKNFSQSGEPYNYEYYKIKGLLDNNAKIRKIYLGYSYHNISTFSDDLLYGETNWIMSTRYFFILPLTEKIKYTQLNAGDVFVFFRNIIGNGIDNTFPKHDHYTFLGLYDNVFYNVKANKTSIDKRISVQFYSSGKLSPFSELNIYYLQKIIDLCKNRNIQLILLKTPLHPYYESKIPHEYIEKYYSIVSQNNLTLVDLKNPALTDSSFLPDGDHITHQTSLLISKDFRERYMK